jgi:lipopolysaccharide/colanic/teichoic acid biosynthesis glycosyltransferase/GT2 family glycosyltransferase
MTISISIIIPVHNGASTIGACLDALQRQTVDRQRYEIIVVDEGSTDGTVRVAEARGVLVLRQDRQGRAAARNLGVQKASGEIVCFTDATCEPAGNWLAEISAPLCHSEAIGCKGIYASRQVEMVARFVQLEYAEKYRRLLSQKNIDFIDTYSAAYRRDILLANSGFDERFPYLADQELSFRLAARGYQMVFRPTAVVYQQHSASLRHYFHKKFIIGYWKAQVVRRFPGQVVNDSHTPQLLKAQMALMTLLLTVVAMLPFGRGAATAVLSLLLAFLLTTLPFIAFVWRRDYGVALSAPWLLAVRAVALTLGYAGGLIRPQPGISGQEVTIGGLSYIFKRVVDIAGSLAGLLLALLVGPWLALAIKIDSPGPIFFYQERVGQRGRPFTLIKFRSMTANAEAELANLLDMSQLGEPVFKLDNDPRVTRVGRFLRRWSLDELPQFWNVLKGEMSLVGPRPEESRLVAIYNDWQRRRLSVKPGLTGPMQVQGRGDLSLETRVRLEVAYIESYSLRQDMAILLQTLPAVLRGNGAR